MNGHLDDDAELYPLGVLDDDAAREVERHIDGCDVCAARVAGAQLVAASLAATLPEAEPSPALERRLRSAVRAPVRANRWDVRSLALAAAFVFALAGAAWQTVRLEQRTGAQNLALATIVHSHFRHVTMTSDEPAPFGAKVLYAPDGSWIYIVVDHPGRSLRAVARTAAGESSLGTLEQAGETATLLVRPKDRIGSIELRGDELVRAHVVLVY